MKKFFLIFAVIITLTSKVTWADDNLLTWANNLLADDYDYYYSTWANNLFNVVEQNYNTWFPPSQKNTYQKLILSTGGTLYYRLYGNNGLVVHVNTITLQHGFYYIVENQWYYLGELHEVEPMLCHSNCKPSYSWSNPIDDMRFNNSYGNNSIDYNNFYWDNPDIGDIGCYGPCSWSYSKHVCECGDNY